MTANSAGSGDYRVGEFQSATIADDEWTEAAMNEGATETESSQLSADEIAHIAELMKQPAEE